MLDDKATKLDSQAAAAFGKRIRDRAHELNLTASDIGRLARIPKQSMTGYWTGARLCGSDRLFPLSDVLRVNARWLASGGGPRSGGAGELVDAADADFVGLPRYDLGQISDDAKANRVETVPIRRDWLFRKLYDTTGLWLAEAPASNFVLGIAEGDVVICSDVGNEPPRENQVYIWRGPAGQLVAQYSILGRGTDAAIVSPSDIAEGDLRPIARIRLRLLAAFDETSLRVTR